MKKLSKFVIIILLVIIGIISYLFIVKQQENTNLKNKLNNTSINSNIETNNANNNTITNSNVEKTKSIETTTNKNIKYTYTFSGNGAAILKETTSDSPSVWFDGRCSNCGKASNMVKNKNASFSFMSNDTTATYKTQDLCDYCNKWYKIEIQCTRIEK